MKTKLLFFGLIFYGFIVKAQEINWFTNFEAAQKQALETNKPILLEFYTPFCKPSISLDKKVWGDEEVQQLVKHYVPFKVNGTTSIELVNKYQVKNAPAIFIIDANGKVFKRKKGALYKTNIVLLLTNYRINTSMLKVYLSSFYQKEKFSTAFRLGMKYSDFAVLSNKKIKKDILRVSKEYFETAEMFLNLSDNPKKEAFIQKIELYEIQARLILNRIGKAEKMLSKWNEVQVDDMNKDLFYKLEYVVREKNKKANGKVSGFNQLSEVEKAKTILLLQSI
ncbi:thioredoxin family protein [Algibacter pacificus]|uniref:thioredoxin family protein n=1 Tax=Algibacter pacificus TaxID=2599389 RepID=UPI0011C7540D|nr:thioredoxin family protein [Algibacter pacificus]